MGPNDVDTSRLNDTTRDASVIDLDAYRAQRGDARAAAKAIDLGAASYGVWILLGLLVLAFFFARR
jgi:hypothetical protein